MREDFDRFSFRGKCFLPVEFIRVEVIPEPGLVKESPS